MFRALLTRLARSCAGIAAAAAFDRHAQDAAFKSVARSSMHICRNARYARPFATNGTITGIARKLANRK